MMRFAWLQFRSQAAVVFGGLAVVAIALAITGPHLVHLYDTTVANCQAHGDCSTATSQLLTNDHTLLILCDALVIVLPAIIGVFWGAPLIARELESGTYRLAWTQSISRARWAAFKLGVVGLGSMAAAGLLSLMVTWWSRPLDHANMNLFSSFDERDIVPLGYAAFAFALGVLCGVVIRRTLPAMATTLASFVAIRLLFNYFVLQKLIDPIKMTFALSQQTVQGFGQINGGALRLFAGDPNYPNAWFYSAQFVNKAGQPLSTRVLEKMCPVLTRGLGGGGPGVGRVRSPVPLPGAGNPLQKCVSALSGSYHEVVLYQPASRYWTFQWAELGIYLGAALVLAGVCIWWVRRRLT